jgi:protein-S-isoprenylcysteine O-methyltransferase Ste14
MTETITATHRPSRFQTLFRPAVLDRTEQAVVVILFCLLTYRVVLSHNTLAPLLLVSEGAVAFFVLIRRPTSAISVRLGDWLLAITATAAPLLVAPIDSSPAFMVVPAVLLVLFGTCFQLCSKLVLRRSFGIAPANRGVKTGGPYRIVRHPMYAGYLASHVGIFMLMPSLFNLTIYVIAWWSQVLRMLAEERLLSHDQAYLALKEKTRYRLIPGIF